VRGEWWRRGTFHAFLEQVPPAQRSADRVPPASWGLLDHWVMASVERSDVGTRTRPPFRPRCSPKLSTDPLMTQVASTMQFSPAAIRGAWRSPRGRELARRLAFMESDPVEHFRTGPKLLVYEKLVWISLPERPPTTRTKMLWQAVERLGQLLFDGKLSKPQILQLAMAWKGTVGFVWLGGVAPALPDLRAGGVRVCSGRAVFEVEQASRRQDRVPGRD